MIRNIGAILIVILLVMTISSSVQVKTRDYDKLIEVVNMTQEAYNRIGEKKKSLKIIVDNDSPMLGQDFTWITTTLGSKSSKLTAGNPNFSAVIYMYLKSLHLEPGDKIAINLSGSFPSLNIAAIIAVESMGLEPLIHSSIGASTYGANDPELTYVDMENLLYEEGFIMHRSSLFSNGGHNDLGSEMDQEKLIEIISRLEAYGYKHYLETNLEKNVSYRMAQFETCKALINVGGNMVSQGSQDLGAFDKHGLIYPNTLNITHKGLIGGFLSSNRPVIHMLDIKALALENELPLEQESYEIGKGKVFYEKSYELKWAVGIILVAFITSLGVMYERYSKEKNAVERHLSA